jgi:poly(hydroxyalkanoate) granule-associated protein
MLKKARAARETEPDSGAQDMAKSVLGSSRQIWLAGLGAFARAQAEGTKVFESLVRQGESVESKTRHAASQTAAAARGAAQAKAKEMQQLAGGTWDKLEKVFEDRVARALSRLGVHSQSDVDRLTERVDALAEAVNQLIKATGGAPVRKPRSSGAARNETEAPAAKAAKRSARATKKATGGTKQNA